MRRRYHRLAPRYGQIMAQDTEYATPMQAALGQITTAPRRALDVGTGTGFAARAVAEAFRTATVVGCDLSPEMLQRAREHPTSLMWVQCDSAYLPFPAGTFDLTVVSNAPSAVRELTRITGPGGTIVMSYSSGARLPGWILRRLSRKLRALGCTDVVWRTAGPGLYIIARKPVEAVA